MQMIALFYHLHRIVYGNALYDTAVIIRKRGPLYDTAVIICKGGGGPLYNTAVILCKGGP